MMACRATRDLHHQTPAVVSEAFFTALRNQEYDKAKSLATEESARIVGVIQTLSEMGGGVNILRDNKKELINCIEETDRAICNYKSFSGPDEKVYLVKLKGQWLVDLKGAEREGSPAQ